MLAIVRGHRTCGARVTGVSGISHAAGRPVARLPAMGPTLSAWPACACGVWGSVREFGVHAGTRAREPHGYPESGRTRRAPHHCAAPRRVFDRRRHVLAGPR
jgi:hypothetical protein